MLLNVFIFNARYIKSLKYKKPIWNIQLCCLLYPVLSSLLVLKAAAWENTWNILPEWNTSILYCMNLWADNYVLIPPKWPSPVLFSSALLHLPELHYTFLPSFHSYFFTSFYPFRSCCYFVHPFWFLSVLPYSPSSNHDASSSLHLALACFQLPPSLSLLLCGLPCSAYFFFHLISFLSSALLREM